MGNMEGPELLNTENEVIAERLERLNERVSQSGQDLNRNILDKVYDAAHNPETTDEEFNELLSLLISAEFNDLNKKRL